MKATVIADHQGRTHRHSHSSDRIAVEHALANQLMRWTHRRDRLPHTY
jgi:hypothetical protein